MYNFGLSGCKRVNNVFPPALIKSGNWLHVRDASLDCSKLEVQI